MATAAKQGTSEDTKTIVTVLLLIFIYPIGVIVMWFWTKWPLWLKILLSVLALPIILVVIGFIAATVLVASNPEIQKLAECMTVCKEKTPEADCESYCANPEPTMTYDQTPQTLPEEAPAY